MIQARDDISHVWRVLSVPPHPRQQVHSGLQLSGSRRAAAVCPLPPLSSCLAACPPSPPLPPFPLSPLPSAPSLPPSPSPVLTHHPPLPPLTSDSRSLAASSSAEAAVPPPSVAADACLLASASSASLARIRAAALRVYEAAYHTCITHIMYTIEITPTYMCFSTKSVKRIKPAALGVRGEAGAQSARVEGGPGC